MAIERAQLAFRGAGAAFCPDTALRGDNTRRRHDVPSLVCPGRPPPPRQPSVRPSVLYPRERPGRLPVPPLALCVAMADGSPNISLRRPDALLLSLCASVAVASAGLLLRSTGVDEELADALPGTRSGGDFATSDTCQACHPAEYDAWHRSYHRTMTQAATPASVLGDFDGVVLEDRGYEWRLERRGNQYWVDTPDPLWFNEPAEFMRRLRPDWPESPPRFETRVVMTTGSHHMQNYWIRRPAELAGALGPDSGALVQIPWVWLTAEGRWVPNQDSFLRPPDASVQGATPWNGTCSQCHSVATEPGILAELGRFETRSVELGIACEACHGPAAEHVRFYRSPVRRYLRHLRTIREPDLPDPTIVNPEKLEARRSAEMCAQCHSFGEWRDQAAYGTSGVPFRPGDRLNDERSVFRYTEDPNDPLLGEMMGGDPLALAGNFWRDGTIRVAGREYNGLLEDAHLEASELTCLSCHSMHAYESPDAQLDPELAGNRSCLSCHADYTGDVSRHTRHLPASSGSECMNCHMPHTTYGLFSAMRSHRIDSPSVLVSVETGRPNACNLCHLDRTLEWTSRYLSEWYGARLVELNNDERTIAASVLWTLEGDAATRTILAWHLGWEEAVQVSGGSWTTVYLAQLLTDPYSATRQVAYRALARLPGLGPFDYDYLAPRPALEAKATEATEAWLRGSAGGPPEPARPHLLIGENRSLDVFEWVRLLAGRDERPLAIIE